MIPRIKGICFFSFLMVMRLDEASFPLVGKRKSGKIWRDCLPEGSEGSKSCGPHNDFVLGITEEVVNPSSVDDEFVENPVVKGRSPPSAFHDVLDVEVAEFERER